MAIETKIHRGRDNKAQHIKVPCKELTRAGFSRVEIQKTPILTRITVYVLNPGRVIGRAGRTIDTITETIKSKVQGRESRR